MPEKQRDQIKFIDTLYKQLIVNKSDQRKEKKQEEELKQLEAKFKLKQINSVRQKQIGRVEKHQKDSPRSAHT